jgi:hypothetical protein
VLRLLGPFCGPIVLLVSGVALYYSFVYATCRCRSRHTRPASSGGFGTMTIDVLAVVLMHSRMGPWLAVSGQ